MVCEILNIVIISLNKTIDMSNISLWNQLDFKLFVRPHVPSK